VTTEVSCLARNAWNTQGKKLRAAPLQQGVKRRSHPLPTKAIQEAAYESGFVSVRPKVIDKARIFRSIGWLTIAGMKSRLCLQMGVAFGAVACRDRKHRCTWSGMFGCAEIGVRCQTSILIVMLLDLEPITARDDLWPVHR
jgi:hypothetical protein